MTNLVLLVGGVIPTNRAVFKAYALATLLSQANHVATEWQLTADRPVIETQVTKLVANPQQTGFRANMMAQFFEKWQQGNTLYYCVTNAAHHPTYPLPSSWVIYGATNLTR